MKSYTDLEQSKKLAEILPVENADMYWLNRHIDLRETKYEVFIIDKSNKYIDFFKSYAVAVDNNEIIPCWSLAALIESIPDECRMEKTPLDQTGEFTYSFVDDYYNIRTYEEDNPVDACVEMIYKFKEKDLL